MERLFREWIDMVAGKSRIDWDSINRNNGSTGSRLTGTALGDCNEEATGTASHG